MKLIRKVTWKNRKNLGISAFVILFLLVFTPFDIQQLVYPERLYYILGYGLCTLLGMYAWDILKPLIYQKIKHYKLNKRQLIYSFTVIIIISLLNFIYSFLIGLIDLSLQSFLLYLGITLAVGIFPSLLVYYEVFRKKEADVKAVTPIDEVSKDKEIIRLKGDNQDETLHVVADKLLFVKAALNYSEVFYLNDGTLQREILRISMNRVEEQLELDYVCRTHRSYICNLRLVENVSRKNKGLLLSFERVKETAYCSRKYKEAIREKLTELGKLHKHRMVS